MDVAFVGQPWQAGFNLDDFLDGLAQEPQPGRLRIAVAWAKRSGLLRVESHLQAWRTAGGTIEIVVGISEGGATRQGLELALAVADSAYLFHDVSGRTFHPKVYLGEGGTSTSLLVGSHNLSAGGVYFNYEAGVVMTVPAADTPTEPLLGQVNGWFDKLIGDPDCCIVLDASALSALVANPAYRIGDEDHSWPAAKAESDGPEEIDSVTETEDTVTAPLFGKSKEVKKKARHSPAQIAKGSGAAPASMSQANAKLLPVPVEPISKPAPLSPSVLAWSRRLDHTAAQQKKGPMTSLTNNLRLAAAKHDIDIKTYWRNVFFQGEAWQVDAAKPHEEFAFIDFDVFVYGVPFGPKTFRVDHNLERVSGQGNVPTILKWGPLGAYLRENDHVDDWVLLERRADDTLALRIESQDPGTAPST